MKKLHTYAMISSCVGATLVAIAIFLTYVVVPNTPATDTWSEEEATAYAEASMTYHNATFDVSLTDIELQQTADDWQSQRDKLDSAISKRSLIPNVLRYAGFACVLTGMSFYVAAKVRNEEE